MLDVHASEAGALSILTDFHEDVLSRGENDVNWTFYVASPELGEKKHVTVKRYPWVKKTWFHRAFFDLFYVPLKISRLKPDLILNLQNSAVKISGLNQIVYLHLPFVLTDYTFSIGKDGLRLWLYQNVLKAFIFKSYRYASSIVVQTAWMKDALAKQAAQPHEKIKVIHPTLTKEYLEKTANLGLIKEGGVLFYPATPFSYKNHITILRAVRYLKEKFGLHYSVEFTINESENNLAKALVSYSRLHSIQVRWIGRLDRSQVLSKLFQYGLVFPSLVESFGLPLLEARELGVPILAAEKPFSLEILDRYENASFFDGTNYIELAEKIMSWEQKYIPSSQSSHELIQHSGSLLDMVTDQLEG